jgi:hypothetical protein
VPAAGCRELCADLLGPTCALVDKRERERREMRGRREKRDKEENERWE